MHKTYMTTDRGISRNRFWYFPGNVYKATTGSLVAAEFIEEQQPEIRLAPAKRIYWGQLTAT